MVGSHPKEKEKRMAGGRGKSVAGEKNESTLGRAVLKGAGGQQGRRGKLYLR